MKIKSVKLLTTWDTLVQSLIYLNYWISLIKQVLNIRTDLLNAWTPILVFGTVCSGNAKPGGVERSPPQNEHFTLSSVMLVFSRLSHSGLALALVMTMSLALIICTVWFAGPLCLSWVSSGSLTPLWCPWSPWSLSGGTFPALLLLSCMNGPPGLTEGLRFQRAQWEAL